MMSIKTVNALSHYTDWTVGHVHSGALGWVAMVSIGSIYLPAAPFVRQNRDVQHQAGDDPLLDRNHRYGSLHCFHVDCRCDAGPDVASAVNADGTLAYSFVESVKGSYPFWAIRVLGGALFLSGMVIMAYNMFKTMAGGKTEDMPVIAPAGHHA